MQPGPGFCYQWLYMCWKLRGHKIKILVTDVKMHLKWNEMKAARLFPQALILLMFSKIYTGLHESCKPTTMGRISKITSNTDRSLHFTDPNGIIQVPRILQNHLRLLYATLFQVPVTVPRKTHFYFCCNYFQNVPKDSFVNNPNAWNEALYESWKSFPSSSLILPIYWQLKWEHLKWIFPPSFFHYLPLPVSVTNLL